MIEHSAALDPLSGFPYSDVVVSGDQVAIASQVPFDENHHLIGPNFAEQAHQVFANLRQCLLVARCDSADVIKVSGYLAVRLWLTNTTRSIASTSARPTRPGSSSRVNSSFRACSYR